MSPVLVSAKRLLRQPSFLVAFVVLLAAALGVNAATQFMKLHFKKLPVPLSKPLASIPDAIPSSIGTWVSVVQDQLSDEVQQELGTDKYVMRYYINSSVFTAAEVADFKGKDYKQSLELLGKLRALYRGKADSAIISFAVTYYTGKADTVAHIPERCYTADGYEPTDAKDDHWPVSKHTPDGTLGVRYINFEDQAGRLQVQKNVAYLFHVNGEYTSDPMEVRRKLQNLLRKYGYYAKVELMIQDKNGDEAADTMKSFLLAALPKVEECLPDWSKLPQQ
jgi:hypothetical protein